MGPSRERYEEQMKKECNQCHAVKESDSMSVFGNLWVCHSCVPKYLRDQKESVSVQEKRSWRNVKGGWRLAGEITLITALGFMFGVLLTPDKEKRNS